MFPAPPMPAFAPGQSVTTTGFLRYDDLTQDGRYLPVALPATLGGIWRELLVDHPGARNALEIGVLPILTRLTLASHDHAIRVDRPVEVHGGFELAHDRDGDEVTRLYMNVWTEVRGAAGRLTPRVTAGELVTAGTVFAEHTFTRLKAPPDQRRVTRLDVEGYPAVPETRYAAPAPATAHEPPAGERWLDELAADAAETCFTLDHTDANQHVNSLVYIRVFSEAVYRRLAATDRSRKLRTRAVDIAYRKPCFAGDRVRAQVRLFEGDDGLGAAGLIAGDDGKPRCYVRVLLGP